VEAGLPHNSAPHVLQTRDGYLWVGTETGLARFDGIRFTTYRAANTPGLPDNWIRFLFEDKAGSLWVGTAHGLCRYRDGKFECVGLRNQAIVNLAEDRTGRIWIGTFSGELWDYQKGNLSSHDADFELPGRTGNCRRVRRFGRATVGRLAHRGFVVPRGRFLPALRGDRGQASGGQEASPRARKTRSGSSPTAACSGCATASSALMLRPPGWDKRSAHKGDRGPFGPEFGPSQISCSCWRIRKRTNFSSPSRASRGELSGDIEDLEGSYWIGTAGDGIVRMRPTGFRMFMRRRMARWAIIRGRWRWTARARSGRGSRRAGAARIAPDGTVFRR
jgi:hypothetical protein